MVCVEPGTVNMQERGPGRCRTHFGILITSMPPIADLDTRSTQSAPTPFSVQFPKLQLTMKFESLAELSVPQAVVDTKKNCKKFVSLSSQKPKKKVSGATHKASTKHFKFSILLHVVFTAAYFFVHGVAPCNAVKEYQKTKQNLNEGCMDLLIQYYHDNCPNQKDIAASDLARLQSLCCSDSETLKFHCQELNKDDGSSILFPACVEEIDCEKGKYCKLTVDENDLPKLEQHTCLTGYFEVENRSSTRSYSFCQNSHTVCSEKSGEIPFRPGNASADTTCVCANGYTPSSTDCSEPFSQHSSCSCKQNKLQAPPSTPVTSTRSPPNTQIPTTSNSITSPATAPDAPTDNDSDDSGSKWFVPVAVFLALFGVIAMFIYAFWTNVRSWCLHIRKNVLQWLQKIDRQQLTQSDPEQGDALQQEMNQPQPI